MQGDDCKKTLQMQQREKRDQFKRLEELNRDIDIFINDFLQEEGLEKDKAAALSALLKVRSGAALPASCCLGGKGFPPSPSFAARRGVFIRSDVLHAGASVCARVWPLSL